MGNWLYDIQEDNKREIIRANERIKRYYDNLDLVKLEKLKTKEIIDLEDSDLEILGIERYHDSMLDRTNGATHFCLSVADSVYKLYIAKHRDGSFSTWEYKPAGVKRIDSTSALIDEVIARWRLRLYEQEKKESSISNKYRSEDVPF